MERDDKPVIPTHVITGVFLNEKTAEIRKLLRDGTTVDSLFFRKHEQQYFIRVTCECVPVVCICCGAGATFCESHRGCLCHRLGVLDTAVNYFGPSLGLRCVRCVNRTRRALYAVTYSSSVHSALPWKLLRQRRAAHATFQTIDVCTKDSRHVYRMPSTRVGGPGFT